MSDVPPLHEDWQSRLDPLQSQWYMFKHQVACDVVFEVGVDAERIGAHMFVLMSRSSVFYKQLVAELPTHEIELPDIEVDPFKKFLEYLYTGNTDIERGCEDDLFKLADRYRVLGLSKVLLSEQMKTLKLDEFCPFVKKYENHMTGLFKHKCLEYVFKQPHAVFVCPNFTDLPFEFLKELVAHEWLVLHEETICQSVLLWASKACENQGKEVTGLNQREVLKDVLYSIRFPLISQDYFTENISEKDLLSAQEEIQIFKYYLKADKSVDDKFKFIAKKRVHPGTPFVYEPEAGSPDAGRAQAGSPATSASLHPTASVPILHRLVSGKTGKVNRFTSQGKGWGYRGNKKDAIAFKVDKDIKLDYVLIYGLSRSNSDMDVTVSLRDQYNDLGTTEMKLQIDSEKPLYEVGIENATGSYGIDIMAGQTYHLVLAVRQGDTGFYGKGGLQFATDEGVTFEFERSRFSTNNTTDSIGQIAGFKFTVKQG